LLSPGLRDRLAQFLPPEAGLGNPVDMIATARSEHYERGLDLLMSEADAAIVIFRPPLVFHEPVERVAEGILRVAERVPEKPIFVCTLSHASTVEPLIEPLQRAGIPAVAMPETAVNALSMLRRIRELRPSNDKGPTTELAVDGDAAAEVLARVREGGRSGLFFDEGARFLSAYGISVCPYAYPDSADEAVRFLKDVGAPVVLKIDAPGLAHRFEQHAVITGIETEEALREAFARLDAIQGSLDLGNASLLAQKMVAGRELIFGLERDPSFGPVVMFGIGGTLVEVLQDVAFGLSPISAEHAERMIRSIRAFPLLEAFRGQPAVALQSLIDIVVAMGRIGTDFPNVVEIDLNPVIADEHGAMAVDILIRLAESRS